MSLGKTLEALKDTTFSKGENLDGKSAVYYGYGSDYTGNLLKLINLFVINLKLFFFYYK